MSQILNMSHHATDEEAEYLTSLLIYNLVERCGGQVQFTAEEIGHMREKLSNKMVQIQLGKELRLRIIDRLPELQ
jgi:DNA-binding NtrC family response regulator